MPKSGTSAGEMNGEPNLVRAVYVGVLQEIESVDPSPELFSTLAADNQL